MPGGEMSFGAAAAFFLGMAHEMEKGREHSLEKAAAFAEEKAKAAIGTYEYNWTPLAASTVARKGADTPLLVDGALRDSYEHTVISGDEAEVGSDNPIAEWQELGTPTIPPRPVLLETGKRYEKEIVAILEAGLVGPLSLKAD